MAAPRALEQRAAPPARGKRSAKAAEARALASSPQEGLDANFPTGRSTMKVPLHRATADRGMRAEVGEEALPAGQRWKRPSAAELVWEQDGTSDDP